MSTLLSVNNLNIEAHTRKGVVQVVKDLSFSIRQGETLGVVGESGCGKTVTALSIMKLLPKETLKISSGNIIFNNKAINNLSDSELEKIRGNEISMIFQEPMTSLNPLFTVGEQVAEVVRRHKKVSKERAWKRAIELLDLVKIANPEKKASDYPFQLSGGQRQRDCCSFSL